MRLNGFMGRGESSVPDAIGTVNPAARRDRALTGRAIRDYKGDT
jgi:hypothetical protein